MKPTYPLAALLLAASLHTPAQAGHHHHDAADEDTAATTTKVVAVFKSVLRAEPSDIGKPLAKIRPHEKLVFVERSPDGKWVQVKKGRVAGWVPIEVLDAIPEATATTLPAPPDPGTTPTQVTPPTPVPTQVVRPTPVPPTQVPPAQVPVLRQAPPPTPPTPVSPPIADTPQRDDGANRPVADPGGAPVAPAVPPGGPAVAPGGPATGPAPPTPALPLAGIWLTVGGGVALLNSSFSSSFQSGINPELFNYNVKNLPGLSIVARLGYTFGYRGLRIGVDGGYRFAGATSIVVQLPARESTPLPQTQPDGSTKLVSIPLPYERQTLSVTSHDADAAVSLGGYFALGDKLEMSLRARGGIQLQAFLPDFNSSAVLPKELLYGPEVGGIVELQSRFLPGFGLRVEGAYIPYAVRQENTGAEDALATAASTTSEKSTGYNVGGSLSLRIIPGFDAELGYRLLATQTNYPNNSTSPRLAFDRDPATANAAKTDLLNSASRSTSQQTIYLGVSFRH